jgi:hypothetical protein
MNDKVIGLLDMIFSCEDLERAIAEASLVINALSALPQADQSQAVADPEEAC